MARGKKRAKKGSPQNPFWKYPTIVTLAGTPKHRNFAQKIMYFFFLIPLVGLFKFYSVLFLFFFSRLNSFVSNKKWVRPLAKSKGSRMQASSLRSQIWWWIRVSFHFLLALSFALIGSLVIYLISLLLIIGVSFLMTLLFPFFVLLLSIVLLYLLGFISNLARMKFRDWQKTTKFYQTHRPHESGPRLTPRRKF